MLPGHVSPWRLESVKDGPITLPLKLGQNRVSIWLHLTPRGGGGLRMAIIQLPQPSYAGTWAELGKN